MKAAAVLSLSSLPLVEVAAPALVVAPSPIPVVIALALLVHNDRPRVASIAYLLGRSTALAVSVAAFLSVPRLGDSVFRPLPKWTDWIVVGIGAAFVALGILVWRRRAARSTSKWHTQLGGIPPSASAALGLFPPLMAPRILAASMAAGAQIGTASSVIDTAVALACYVTVASSTVATPIVIYLALGPRIDPKLERLRQWIHNHHHAATATTLIMIGAIIVLYVIS